MNIFIKESYFFIQKIKSTSDGWMLYSKSHKPVFISKKNYTGKMPSSFKLLWQSVFFEYQYIDDFIIFARLNHTTLFKVPESEYPEHIKKKLEQGEHLWNEYYKNASEKYKEIRKALQSYLLTIPLANDWEEQCSKLPICLRAYLQYQWYMKPSTPELLQKINLMLRIFQLVEIINKRHSHKEQFWVLHELKRCGSVIWGCYIDIDTQEKAIALKDGKHSSLRLHREVENLITTNLPPVQNKWLCNYLNFLIRDILNIYLLDQGYLSIYRQRDGWSGRYLLTDEEEYKRQYEDMKLLQYKSFIFSEEIPVSELKVFLENYSLL